MLVFGFKIGPDGDGLDIDAGLKHLTCGKRIDDGGRPDQARGVEGDRLGLDRDRQQLG